MILSRRPCESRDPYSAAPRFRADGVDTICNNQSLWLWVPAFAGTTRSGTAGPSDPAVDVALHAVGHLDQPAPRLFQERHHAVHVAVARQRDLDLALALGGL